MSLRGWMGSFEVDGFRFGDPEELDPSRLSDDELLYEIQRGLEGVTQFPDEFWKDWEPPAGMRARLGRAFDAFPPLKGRLSPEGRRAFGLEV